jgi:hypothetical protein
MLNLIKHKEVCMAFFANSLIRKVRLYMHIIIHFFFGKPELSL